MWNYDYGPPPAYNSRQPAGYSTPRYNYEPETPTDDDSTEISDNDSILALAKRLDASSVLSDPSFIEGTVPHRGGVEPSGINETADSFNVRRNAAPYSSRLHDNGRNNLGRGDLDSIASDDHEDEEDFSVYTDGSGSQYTEDTPKGVPMGVPRVGHHHDVHYAPQMRHYDMNEAHYSDYFTSTSMRTQLPSTSGPSRSPSRLNTNNTARNMTRSKSPSRMARSDSPSIRERERNIPPSGSNGYHNGSYSRDPNFVDSGQDHMKEKNRRTRDIGDQVTHDQYSSRRNSTWRKVKLIAVPFMIVLVIAVSITVVFVTRNEDDQSTASQSQDIFRIASPTVSPTFVGDYSCPAGTIGPVPVKDCVGYVQCNGLGGIEGGVISCQLGTLFDVNLIQCNWAEDVECFNDSTTSESLDDLSLISPTSKPSLSPETTTFPQILERFGPISTFGHELSFKGIKSPGDMGLFERNMENYINIFFSLSRADYFGQEMAMSSEKDHLLNSVSGVKVDLLVTNFVFTSSRHLADDAVDLHELYQLSQPDLKSKRKRLQQGPELVMRYNQTTEYSTSDLSISIGAIVRHPYEVQYQPTLINYLKSSNPDVFSSLVSIEFLDGDIDHTQTVSTAPILSFSPSRKPTVIPTVSLSIHSTSFPTLHKTSPPTIMLATNSPSHEPTTSELPILTLQKTSQPTVTLATNSPSSIPTKSELPVTTLHQTSPPTIKTTYSPSTKPVSPYPTEKMDGTLELATIKGFMWLDSNGDGLYQDFESPSENTFANLEFCNGTWVDYTRSNADGQYQFFDVVEGEYRITFFLPTENYEFTIPMVVSDNATIHSDAAILTGRSPCVAVNRQFSKSINAGYVLTQPFLELSTNKTSSPTSNHTR